MTAQLPARWLPAAWILGVLMLVGVGAYACRAPEHGGGPDWPRIRTELELGSADLRDVALIIGDEGTSAALLELADVIDGAAMRIGDGGYPDGALDMIDVAVSVADDLIERLPEGAQDEARVAVVVVRAALRRARAYAPEPKRWGLMEDAE